jgi:hypothetical protein
MKLWADGLHDSLRRGLSLDFALSLEEGTAQNSGPDNFKRLAIMGNELAGRDVQRPAAAMETFYDLVYRLSVCELTKEALEHELSFWRKSVLIRAVILRPSA